jgi:hypothetical protein
MVMPAEVRLEAISAGKVHQPGQRDRSKTAACPWSLPVSKPTTDPYDYDAAPRSPQPLQATETTLWKFQHSAQEDIGGLPCVATDKSGQHAALG